VSLSRAVRDSAGHLVDSHDRRVVGHFLYDTTVWGLAYSAVKLDPEIDLSKEINDQVGNAHGDAVVRLEVGSKPCGMNFIPVLAQLPFWPGCARIHAEGEIIQVVPTNPTAVDTRTASASGGSR